MTPAKSNWTDPRTTAIPQFVGLEFDWRHTEDKATRNPHDHGVSFELVTTVFNDPFAIETAKLRQHNVFDTLVNLMGPPVLSFMTRQIRE